MSSVLARKLRPILEAATTAPSAYEPTAEETMSIETYKQRLTRMPEGEVAIRLAFYLLNLPRASQSVTVCLDRHHVHSGGKIVFPVRDFMFQEGWMLVEQNGKYPWLGNYEKQRHRLIISANSRGGDVIAQVGKKRVRAECKKGILDRSVGNPANKLIHEAIGQLMTIEEYAENDVLLVAVPWGISQRAKLVWQRRPLMEKVGISLVLVGRDGTVEGLPNLLG